MANANLFAQFAKPAKSFMDYTAEMDRADLRKQEIQQNAFAAAGQRQKFEQGNRLQELYQQLGAGPQDQIGPGLRAAGRFDEAAAFEKSGADLAQTRANTGKVGAETEASKAKLFRESIGRISSNPTPETLQVVLADLERSTGKPPGYGMQFFAGATTNEQIRERAILFGLELDKQLPKAGTQNQGGYNLNTSTDPITGVVKEMGRKDITQTADNAASQVTSAANNAATQATSIANNTATNVQSGENNLRTVRASLANNTATNATSAANNAANNTRANNARGKGPMSVTLQKELLESDDVVQTAGNIVRTLEAAKAKNKDAYSGYLAKPRATFASNVLGSNKAADATIDIDNMMTGQALESLKVIFGGMPTEGERKILLDMQASVDKTAGQREAIMNRAIAAAKRRADYAGKKAKSIRDGSYLTDGVQQDTEQSPPPANASAPMKFDEQGNQIQ